MKFYISGIIIIEDPGQVKIRVLESRTGILLKEILVQSKEIEISYKVIFEMEKECKVDVVCEFSETNFQKEMMVTPLLYIEE